MPKLNTLPQLVAGIRKAINGDDHFVIVTDRPSVHVALVGLAAGCALSGACALDELAFAAFDFIDGNCGHRSAVSILAIPKSALTAADLQKFAANVGFKLAMRPEGDLVVLGDQEFLMGVLQSLHGGTARTAGVPAMN